MLTVVIFSQILIYFLFKFAELLFRVSLLMSEKIKLLIASGMVNQSRFKS